MELLEKTVEQTNRKIGKWTALYKSCRADSCGEIYAKQKVEQYNLILKALMQFKQEGTLNDCGRKR